MISRAPDEKEHTQYRMQVNKNHQAPVQFTTMAHELAHLFLGHLGPDKKLNVPSRPQMEHTQREIEAESVAYMVCARNGVDSSSETYLTNYVNAFTKVDQIDVYQVMRAAGQVETILGLASHTKFDKPVVKP